MTIKEFAEKIQEILKSESLIEYKDLPVDDPKQRQPDISLAKRILDWEPQVSLDEGLRETIQYFQNKIG